MCYICLSVCIYVLVHGVLLQQNTWDWVICKEPKIIFSKFWRLGSPEARLQHLVRTFLLHHYTGRRQIGKEAKWGQTSLFIMSLILLISEEVSWPHYFSKVPPLNTLTMAITFQHELLKENTFKPQHCVSI